jgi:hypothetical protein
MSLQHPKISYPKTTWSLRNKKEKISMNAWGIHQKIAQSGTTAMQSGTTAFPKKLDIKIGPNR